MFLLGIDWLVKQVTEKKNEKPLLMHRKKYTSHMILVCQAIRRKTFAEKDRQNLRERRQILA